MIKFLLGPDRSLGGVAEDKIEAALVELWGSAAAATWNRNRAAIGSWLAWCTDKKHWTAPAVPAAAERRREHNDETKAVSRSRIDPPASLRRLPPKVPVIVLAVDTDALRDR